MSDTTRSYGLSFSVHLDFPDLYPQAVMYSIFESDPKPTLRDNVSLVASRSPLSKDDAVSKAAILQVAWDMFFAKITGNNVYMAAPPDTPKPVGGPNTGDENVEGTYTGIYISSVEAKVTSSGETVSSPKAPSTARRWIVSRSHNHRGKPIAWSIAIDLAPGKHPIFVLSKQNSIDLSSEV